MTRTLDELVAALRQHAREHGNPAGDLWHETDIDGHHLYLADTSFGDGPILRISGPTGHHAWMSGPPDGTQWRPITAHTTNADLEHALKLAARATWIYLYDRLNPGG